MTAIARLAPPPLDAGVAAGWLVAVVGGTYAVAAVQGRALDAIAVLLAAVAAAALGWRRVAPVAAAGVTAAAVGGYLLAGYPYGPVQLCVVAAVFEVARQRRLSRSLLACAAVALVVTAATASRLTRDADIPALLVALWTSWSVLPWSLGALVHVRAASLARTRRELVARATLDERLRVAREVHDVAGHGFSLVAVQAGVALTVFDEQPEQARASLQAIRSASRRALTDLRATLDAVEPAAADIGELVADVRAAGLQVRLDGSDDDVPASVRVVAYRVVQEALTNVLRHAGTDRADVRVARDGDAVVVEVRDQGSGGDDVTHGRGLTGMRTRVEAAGGTFAAGRRDDGGFQVTARLPGGTT